MIERIDRTDRGPVVLGGCGRSDVLGNAAAAAVCFAGVALLLAAVALSRAGSEPRATAPAPPLAELEADHDH